MRKTSFVDFRGEKIKFCSSEKITRISQNLTANYYWVPGQHRQRSPGASSVENVPMQLWESWKFPKQKQYLLKFAEQMFPEFVITQIYDTIWHSGLVLQFLLQKHYIELSLTLWTYLVYKLLTIFVCSWYSFKNQPYVNILLKFNQIFLQNQPCSINRPFPMSSHWLGKLTYHDISSPEHFYVILHLSFCYSVALCLDCKGKHKKLLILNLFSRAPIYNDAIKMILWLYFYLSFFYTTFGPRDLITS